MSLTNVPLGSPIYLAPPAGQIGGTATAPTVLGIQETSGPTLLTAGAIPDGYLFKRTGTALVGQDPSAYEPAIAAGTAGQYWRGDKTWQTLGWSALSGVPSTFTPAAHVLDSASHTVSGETPGYFLKALTATTFGFVAHGLTYSDVGALAAGGTAANSSLLNGQSASYYLNAGNITAGVLAIAQGGTGATNAAGARSAISAAVLGANNDITSLSGLTTPLAATMGGTGNAIFVVGDLLYANATTTLARLAIGSAGTCLVGGSSPVWSSSPTLTGLNLSGLTASEPVVADGSKNLTSLAYIGITSFRNNLGLETNSNVVFGNLTFGPGRTYYEGYGGDVDALAIDVGDAKARAFRDAQGWLEHNSQVNRVRLAINNGGFGGGATPGNLLMNANSIAVYDTTAVNANSKGFVGAVFDGRYIYFVPYNNGAYSGQVTRYDTTGSFTAAGSWSVYDTTAVNANSKGFRGAVFDGRYIYFAPNNNGASFGQVTRYDTTGSFTAAGSWSVYDTTAVNANSKGFFGAVFDGRYIYFAPNNNGAYFGQVTRYDTTGSFTAAGSWSVYDTTAVNANSKGFQGAVFDGRYIYFVPYNNGAYSGQVTRYDTTGSFTAAGSWSVYDTTAVNANSKAFYGAVFDGRYIYFAPNYNGAYFGQVTRYDTTGSFTAAGSWSVYDTTAVNANSKGFVGAVFDGRYIYFVPYNNGAYSGQVTRYDTTGSFTAAGSWSVYDTTAVNANSKGFYGAVFDGRYIYFVPYNNGAYSGQVTRLNGWVGGIDALLGAKMLGLGA